MEFTERSKEIYQKDNLYYYTKNNKVINKECLSRIHSLGIPPAYNKIWISTNPKENIQAVALDGKNKKQYFYSSEWVQQRKTEKSERLEFFSSKLRKLKFTLNKDLQKPIGDKDNTMAHMIKIVEISCIRIGNKKYMDQNDSFGLTTLQKKHVSFSSGAANLSFAGKHKVLQNIVIEEKPIVDFLKKMYKLPTEWLMKYKNNDNWYRVSAQDLNNYLHSIVGKDFTIKDFRTHGANIIFFRTLRSLPIPATATEIKRNINTALRETAKRLGNNPATSKKSYVMDYIIEQYTADPQFIKKQKGKVNLYSLDTYR